MTDPQPASRALSSLRRAIAPGTDDFGHPDHEDLIAFAELRLGAVDREIVESHIATCEQCAEDVRDIAELRDEMHASPVVVKSRWKYVVAAVAGVAAVLAVVVFVRGAGQHSVAQQASAPPAPSVSPRERLLAADEQTAVAAAIAAGRVDVPSSVRALAGSVGQLLGPGAPAPAMQPMSPSGTAVATASPQFSWRAVSGAASYRVAVFDENFREVATSGAITGTTWTPAVQLPPNVTLAWQVTARMPNGADVLAPAPPQPEARFSVLDAASAARIADLRARLADQPLALGILLAKAGLVDDAAREFDRAAARPADAELAAKLRASLNASR